jgi:poly-gamma-glutamate synthesis protein (capsule biosynthesis protein)
VNKKVIILSIIATVLAAGILFLPPLSIFTPDKISEPVPIVEAEKPISLSISAVGDVMVHKPQFESAFDDESGLYNFDENYTYVAPYIASSDLALCNLETVFAGGKPVGYPSFNSPDSLADSLKKAGFDVALLSNNHILDKGTTGMIRTVDILKASGIRTTGVRLEGEKPYLIMNVKGINIGIISYTYETPKSNGRKTLNSNIVSDIALPLINTFNYDDLDLDLVKIKENINLARSDGAEVIVCYFHWGEEYKLTPNDFQIKIAKSIAEAGTDIIFASHPHVLQPAEIIVNEETGKETAVFYSMGNFISNQRTETLDNRYTEEGIIAKVEMDFMKSTKKITNFKASAIPIWVDKYKLKSIRYAVIPLDKDISVNPSIVESGHLKRALVALEDIINIVGEKFVHVKKEEI